MLYFVFRWIRNLQYIINYFVNLIIKKVFVFMNLVLFKQYLSVTSNF